MTPSIVWSVLTHVIESSNVEWPVRSWPSVRPISLSKKSRLLLPMGTIALQRRTPPVTPNPRPRSLMVDRHPQTLIIVIDHRHVYTTLVHRSPLIYLRSRMALASLHRQNRRRYHANPRVMLRHKPVMHRTVRLRLHKLPHIQSQTHIDLILRRAHRWFR